LATMLGRLGSADSAARPNGMESTEAPARRRAGSAISAATLVAALAAMAVEYRLALRLR
jgi:hypothetical protein